MITELKKLKQKANEKKLELIGIIHSLIIHLGLLGRDSFSKLKIMARIFNIVALRKPDEEAEIDAIIKDTLKQLDELIKFCEEKKYKSSASYLRNAAPGMFRAFEKRLNGKSSSLVERV